MSRFLFFRRREQEAADPDLPYADGGSFTPGNTGRRKSGKPSDVDPMLPEKKRARRRLVGAVIITLAAIIVLPMIFDPEPQTVSQDLLIDIPSRDKPQTLSREPAKKKADEKPAVVANADKPANEPAATASDKKEAAAKAADNASGNAGKTDNAKAKPAVADSKADTKSRPDAKADAKTDTAQKQDDPIGQLIAKNTNAHANEQEKQEKIIIQVAAVSTQDKAKELQEKLQKAGLNSYVQKVALKDGGERIRIRIGPLSGKKEVNSTCAKLSELNLPCTLVN